MMKKRILLALLLGMTWQLQSQTFQEGIYLSYEAFQNDEPDIAWDSLYVKLFVIPATYRAELPFIQFRKSEDTLDLSKVWGFTYGDMTYVHHGQGKFAGLRLRGAICYYEYTFQVQNTKAIKAYNPETGKPFRSGNVQVKQPASMAKCFSFKDGNSLPLSLETVKFLVKDDAQLIKALDSFGEAEAQKRLFKTMKIYNDRHPITD